jgi:hypothetical protein
MGRVSAKRKAEVNMMRMVWVAMVSLLEEQAFRTKRAERQWAIEYISFPEW